MNDLSVEQIGGFLRLLIPVFVTIILVFLLNTPIALPALGILQPIVAVTAVYYWNVHFPDAMPAAAAFAIGLFTDALSGGPLGLMALTLVVVQWATVTQRRALIGKPFVILWLGFGLTVLVVVVFLWLFSVIYYVALLDPLPILVQGLITVATFPLLAGIFSQIRLYLQRAA